MPKVLTKAELACLLEVPTTVRMAKTILRRNQALLKLLLKRKEGTVKIGCPHCQKAGGTKIRVGDCERCDYPRLEGETLYETRCLNYSFGGITARDVGVVDLRADAVLVEDDDYGNDHWNDSIIWAKGHIEWAREVIRRSRKS